MYIQRGDFDFDRVDFPFFDGEVPRAASYGAHILSWFILLEPL